MAEVAVNYLAHHPVSGHLCYGPGPHLSPCHAMPCVALPSSSTSTPHRQQQAATDKTKNRMGTEIARGGQ